MCANSESGPVAIRQNSIGVAYEKTHLLAVIHGNRGLVAKCPRSGHMGLSSDRLEQPAYPYVQTPGGSYLSAGWHAYADGKRDRNTRRCDHAPGGSSALKSAQAHH